MRHGLVLFISLGLLGAALGCTHLHGVCDCDIPAPGPKPPLGPDHAGGPAHLAGPIPAAYDAAAPTSVYPGGPAAVYGGGPAPAVQAEVLKEMPKPIDKDNKTPPAKPDGKDSKEGPMKPAVPPETRE
jgi:hypothetical protein